jgi:hypothetical protein
MSSGCEVETPKWQVLMLRKAQKVRPSSHGNPLAPSNTNKGDEHDRSVRMDGWDVPSWIWLGPVIIHLLRSRLQKAQHFLMNLD